MILAGKTAIVTGGAVRIGREICRELAAAEVNVCVHYRTSERAAHEAVQELKALGVQACAVSADLQQAAQSAGILLEEATAQLGPVHILVNSASIFEPGRLLQTDEEQWDRHMTINLKSPFFLTREFVRRLPAEMTGSVVNIVDWRGERPLPGHDVYTISKAGLIAQTRLLAQELGPRIRVNAIAPGAILPPGDESQEAFQQRAKKNPLQKTGAPTDIARAVIYLLTAPFVTGEILHVTGGEGL